MTEENICPKCGRQIPPDAPGGICPVCLLSEATQEGQSGTASPAGRDINLLFALFAFVLNYIDAERFANTVQDWVQNPTTNVADRLTEAGAISKAVENYLDGLIAHALDFYGGNVSQTLESLGGHNRVASILKLSAGDATRDLLETKLALNVSEELLEVEPPPAQMVDEKPGRYTGSSEHSRGGMGRILIVHDELLARDIALKELLPPSDEYVGPSGSVQSPMRASASLTARFLREARITGRLEHPSIVPVYELGRRSDGSLYYTMRLVRGKTLKTVLEECKSLEDRLQLLPNVVDLCMALAYAHSKGVIHRDIKPSNIMIGEFGETVIIDWGLAKVIDGDETIDDTLHRLHGSGSMSPDETATGEILGSPHYMSPEQAAGRIDELDARSDVFSLGVLLYEILTNCAAFDKTTLDELAKQIRQEDPVSITKRETHVPQELVSICERAMNKQKGRRYQSAKQLGDDIGRFMSGSLVSVYNYTPLERVRHFYGRHKAVLNAIAIAFVAISVTVALAFVRIERSRNEAVSARDREAVAREQAQSDRYLAQIRLVGSYIESNNPAAANKTLWNVEPARRNWEWGYLLNRSRPEILRIDGFSNGALSPLGDRIVAASRTRPLTLFSYPEGQPLREFPGTTNLVLSVAFSKDGRKILTGRRDNQARLWDAQTGILMQSFQDHFRGVHTAFFTPDEDRVVTVSFDNSVRIYDAANGDQAAVLRAGRLGLSGAIVNSEGTRLAAWLMDNPRVAEEVQMWNMGTAERMWTREGNRPAFAVDGANVLYVKGRDIIIAAVDTGIEIARLQQHEAKVARVALTDDGRYAVSGSSDGQIIVWDLSTRAPAAHMSQPRGVRRIVINTSRMLCATTSLDPEIRIWKLPDGELVTTLAGQAQAVSTLEFALQSPTIFTTARDQSVRMWDDASSPGIADLGRGGAVRDMAVAASANLLAVARNSEVTLYRSDTGEAIEIFSSASWSEDSRIDLSADGRVIAFMIDGFSTIIWDRVTKSVMGVLDGHTGTVNALDLDGTGATVVTAGWDGVIRSWNLNPFTFNGSIALSDASIGAVTIHPDQKRFVAGNGEGQLFVGRVPDMTVEIVISGHASAVTAVTFAPDGALVASTSGDNETKLWPWPALTEPRNLSGHVDGALDIAFSGDGTRAVSTGNDGTVRIWECDTASELLRFEAPASTATAWIGDSIYTGFLSGVVRQRQAAPYSPLADAEEELRRFEAYRKAHRDHTNPEASSAVPLPKTVFLANTSASEFVSALADAFSGAEGPAQTSEPAFGLPIPSEANNEALAGLLLARADRLLRIDGEQITDSSAFEVRLNSIASSIASGSTRTFSIEVRNPENYWEYRYHILPVIEKEQRIELSRTEAISRLNKVLDALRTGEHVLTEYAVDSAKRLGLAVDSETLAGIFIPGNAAILERQDHLAFGLGPEDRLTRIDDVPVTSIPQFIESWATIADEISNGDRSGFTLEIERGLFQRVSTTVDIL